LKRLKVTDIGIAKLGGPGQKHLEIIDCRSITSVGHLNQVEHLDLMMNASLSNDFSSFVSSSSKVKELILARNSHLTDVFSLSLPRTSTASSIALTKLDVSHNSRISDLRFLTYLSELVAIECSGIRTVDALPFRHVPNIILSYSSPDRYGKMPSTFSQDLANGFKRGGLKSINEVFPMSSGMFSFRQASI
jgi:hypothetical protein